MTSRFARRLLVLATVGVAAGALGAVPALADDDDEPAKAACTRPEPAGSPLGSLLGTGGAGSPADANAKQACNSQKSHVDRSGEAPTEDADGAESADGSAPAAGADATDATDATDTDTDAADTADTTDTTETDAAGTTDATDADAADTGEATPAGSRRSAGGDGSRSTS